jgi:hypothetical protein
MKNAGEITGALLTTKRKESKKRMADLLEFRLGRGF